MAHQWFGDLVTMEWWDDLWLNEGFASWMEIKATDHFHPEWHMWLDSQDAKEGAMRVDARAGTHPIVQPILDVLQANEAFDTITYSKGQAVIRMLENYTGEDAFRAGVRNYIKAHAYGNTVTDDLWRELDKTSPRPVTKIAHDFTLQPGVPLIRVTKTANGIHLEQDRFAADDSAKTPLSWHVPVVEASVGSTKIWHDLVSRDKPADIAVANDEVPVVNAGQGRIFPHALRAGIVRATVSESPQAKSGRSDRIAQRRTRAGVFRLRAALAFLDLAQQANSDMDAQVLIVLTDRLQGLTDMYRGLPGEAKMRAFTQKTLEPLLAKVGWEAVPGESQNTTLVAQRPHRRAQRRGRCERHCGSKEAFCGLCQEPAEPDGRSAA